MFPKEYQEPYSSPDQSVTKAVVTAVTKTKVTNRQPSRSRSPSPEQEHPIAKYGRSKSKNKRSNSTSRRESSQLPTDNIVDKGRAPRPNSTQVSNVFGDKNSNMAPRNQSKKMKEIQAKHEALLKQLRESGQTLDENGQLVSIDSDTDENYVDNDHVSSDSSDEERAVTYPRGRIIVTGKKSKTAHSSKAVANMKAQLAVTTHKKAKKKKDDGAPVDETISLIRECIRKDLWALSKFVNGENSQNKAAAMCLKLLNIKEFNGTGDKADARRAEWIKAYGPVVTTQLNNHRSYVQNRCKDACFRWMDDHEGTMPSQETLKKCLERKIDLKNDAEVAVMKWYWDDLIAMAAGNLEDWHPEKRHYMLLSTAAPPNNAEMPYITPSTEAIALAFIANNETKWPALHAAKQQYPKAREVRAKAKVVRDGDEFTWYKGKVGGILLCNGEKYMTKFTETAAGQKEFTGWSKAGRDYNVEMKKLSENARKRKGVKKFEQAILDMIRADHGKSAASATEENNAKRRKTGKAKEPVVEDEDDGMEF